MELTMGAIYKRLEKTLFSMQLSAILLTILAVASGVATFIENDYGNEAARAVVYNAIWFELVFFLLGINLVGSIYRYRMWKLDKFFILLFHVSFIIILIGAAITRYFGYEGTMHIREGDSSNVILSDEIYLNASWLNEKGEVLRQQSWPMRLTPITSNRFVKQISANGKTARIEYRDFYKNAVESVVPSPTGKPYLQFMITGGMGGRPDNISLEKGSTLEMDGTVFDFEGEYQGNLPAIHIRETAAGSYEFRSDFSASSMSMDTKLTKELGKNKYHPLQQRHLYQLAGLSFVLRNVLPAGVKKLTPTDMQMPQSGLILDVDLDGVKRRVELAGGDGVRGKDKRVRFGNNILVLSYGALPIRLPFRLRLDDFLVERYPGSMSPSSYESHVIIEDPDQGVNEPYRIYMNHILIHRGYRFYQSSYDQDERGTILTVAMDPGKWPTYLGYFLMSLGFLVAPFTAKSRFRRLGKLVDRDSMKHAASVIVAFLLPLMFVATPGAVYGETLPADFPVVESSHADRFSRLLVHDVQGRLKPMDTLSTEVMNKVARTHSLYDLSANQIVLGMAVHPDKYQTLPLIKVTDPDVKQFLKISPAARYASFSDFFDEQGQYRLLRAVEKAQRKPPAQRTTGDKKIIKIDEKANIVYMLSRGDLFRVLPVPEDPAGRWTDPMDAAKVMTPGDVERATAPWNGYLEQVRHSLESGDWKGSNDALDQLIAFQKQYGSHAAPSERILEAEIFFNRINIFDRLTPVYLILGFAFLILVFVRIAFHGMKLRYVEWVLSGLFGLAFLGHTFGLALRWYVSGHAPWSNGYESLIYIAWATALAGFIFARNSAFSFAATAIVSGLALLVAHLSWMDPQITTLVPVLKSYWLTIHVSVISASYGFLALAALLGFLGLILFIFRHEQRERIDYSIIELTRINEMSMMIGLALLSIGNILGAVWANESWGRYWSWDPKETWTFVSMLIYAVVLHFRFIPKLNTAFALSAGSLMAFAAILMTYFGVNYYLTGLHSYAAGDPVPIPAFLYYALGTIALVMGLAYRKRDGKRKLMTPSNS